MGNYARQAYHSSNSTGLPFRASLMSAELHDLELWRMPIAGRGRRRYSAFGAPDSLGAHTPKKPATL
jgi:hypothetical protein